MMFIQCQEYTWLDDRYEGDFELYGNNPRQRTELILWLQHNFGPSSLVIFSGDVHHGSVVTGLYGYGPFLDKIKAGKADWAMRVVQITSSPIKNVKKDVYEKKRWWKCRPIAYTAMGDPVRKYDRKNLYRHASIHP